MLEIDLSQITADLTVLMTEVDRIEAIAAGKTPADADKTDGQATNQGAESRESGDVRIQKGRAAQRQGWPRGDEPTAGHRHRPEQKGQDLQAWPEESQKRLTQPQEVRAMPYIAIVYNDKSA